MDKYYYLAVSENKHGNWGWVDLYYHEKGAIPINIKVNDGILYWQRKEGKEKAEHIAREFNKLSGYGNYIG